MPSEWGQGAVNNDIGWQQGDNNDISWGLSHTDSWSGDTSLIGVYTDTDAQAFITAASITDPTQQSAVNQLVVDLKAASIWAKMKAVYPFVGGSATTHKWNLKDPRDLDAAYRLSFAGGWTHSSTGAKPNGTTGYSGTFWAMDDISESTRRNDFHMSYYSRTQNPIGDGWVMGRGNTGTGNPLYGLAIKRGGGSNVRIFDSGNFTSGGRISSSETDARGFYVGSRLAVDNAVFYKNASSIGSNLTSTSHTDLFGYGVYLGCCHGDIDYFQDNECAFSSFGVGLNSTEVTALNTAVATFNTTLSRNI